MTRRVLVTGFDPFGSEPFNSSLEAVRALEAIAGVALTVRTLPTEFGRASQSLKKAIRHSDPDAVICVGQARGRSQITPERVAINVADARRIPDNVGHQPTDEPVVEGGPVTYWSTLPIKEIETELRDASIPARISDTAGTYVCNHVFYSLMHLLANERPTVSGGFVHVPILPGQDPEGQAPSMALPMIVRALELMVDVVRSASQPGAMAAR